MSDARMLFRSSTLLLVLLSITCAASTAHAQTFSLVWNFGSFSDDPTSPFISGIIAQGRDGNLYSGADGGLYHGGAAYMMTPSGTLNDLYHFKEQKDGCDPTGGLTLGTDGNFYGTTYGGGFCGISYGTKYGTVFKMTSSGGLTTLYTFTDANDGALPVAPPVQGTDGNYYGATCNRCNGSAATGYGSVYKITPAGKFTVLYTCDGTICWDIEDPLVQGTDGNFYGTSVYGGAYQGGSVFKVSSAGKITLLYSFSQSAPIGGLVQASDGNFYGTTLTGNGQGGIGYGTIFKITPTGKLTMLHNMNRTTDGGDPYAGLVQATDGNLYGVNSSFGAASTNCPNGCGTIFRISLAGTFTVLYNFDLTTGNVPATTLIQHTNGLLYGTAQQGGAGTQGYGCGAQSDCGVLFSLNIGAAPFVTFVGSPVAKVGKTVEVLGQGFTGTTNVSFGGAAASYTVVSDTYLTAIVPSGATTSTVSVTTPGGTLNSNKAFRVTPQLLSFTPPSGPVGTQVTITGMSLTQTSKVTFGGVAAATFTVNSDTQVTATVPTGAKTGKIVITTPGGTASSSTSFTVTL